MSINIEEYPFLKEIMAVHHEHTEVSEEIVNIYKAKYDFLNTYKFNQYSSKRNQMSSPGAWLSKDGNPGAIDIVGDVLTSKSVFKFVDENNMPEESKRLFGIIRMIIFRGYRVWHCCKGNNLDNVSDLQEILKALKINKYFEKK